MNSNNKKSVHTVPLNAQGLRNQSKRVRLKEWLSQQNVNIILIQETHFTSDIENNIRNYFDHFLQISFI